MGDIVAKVKQELREGLILGKKFYEEFPSVFTGGGINLNHAVQALANHFNKKIFIKSADLTKIKEGVSGFTFVREDGVYIVVNSLEPPERQRFTVAHELGHIYNKDINLDDIDNLNIVYRSDLEFSSSDPEKLMIEQRANAFASEILMPEEQVLNMMKARINAEEMAAIFGVSPQTMKIRIAGILHSQDQNQDRKNEN